MFFCSTYPFSAKKSYELFPSVLPIYEHTAQIFVGCSKSQSLNFRCTKNTYTSFCNFTYEYRIIWLLTFLNYILVNLLFERLTGILRYKVDFQVLQVEDTFDEINLDDY